MIATATISWTAHGQPSSTDSVTITRDQQRQCIKWYNNTIAYRDTIIPAKDSIIEKNEYFIKYQETEIRKRDARIARADNKLKRRTWISAGTGAGAGAIIVAFLFGLLK